MKTDPFSDSFAFLIGATSDHASLGAWRLPIAALFVALLAASLAIAAVVWRRDPAQRRASHLCTWLFRVLIGAMWFQGSIWKLPFPVSGGLQYWTEQMAKNAAFPVYGDLVQSLLLPNMAVVDPLVYAAELGLAVSFILGVAVRPVAVLGALYTLGLWIGLYRHPDEWPWEYIFLAVLQGEFVLHAAGRSLGLDALLPPAPFRRARPPTG